MTRLLVSSASLPTTWTLHRIVVAHTPTRESAKSFQRPAPATAAKSPRYTTMKFPARRLTSASPRCRTPAPTCGTINDILTNNSINELVRYCLYECRPTTNVNQVREGVGRLVNCVAGVMCGRR